jgi:ribosomal protein L37E
MSMNRKGLFPTYRRLNGIPMKEKEKKCWECGSLPWRVEGDVCKDCGLEFSEEITEVQVSLKSSMGEFEDKF